MEIPRTIENIKALIENRVQESLHLDYKISKAIDDSKRNEIAKDVSAFANSDGGVLIYGVKEDQHLPVEIDDGLDHRKYTREWLEQVLVSNISPIIHELEIVQIPINETHSIYVVAVPKSARGPHQERGSNKYFKRYSFKSSPMEDYEINDIRNRAFVVPPLINIDLVIEHGVIVLIEISNIGNVPALDVKTKLPSDFVWEENKEQPPFFQKPVKYFPPGKKFSFTYSTFQNIINNASMLDAFSIDVEYLHSRTNEIYSDSFYFDLNDHMYSRYEEHEIYELGKVIKESITELTKKIDDLGKYTQELTRIAGPSGLSLSVTTLKNIEAIKNSSTFEKLDPSCCDYKIFKEVLGVSDQVAYNLYHFFRRNNFIEGKLKDVDGVDEVLLNQIKEKFVIAL